MVKAKTNFAIRCLGCSLKLLDGDEFYADWSGGFLHAECCGDDPASFVDDEGEPLKPGDPIPQPQIWKN